MIRTIAIAGVIAACTALGGCAGNSARFLIDPPAPETRIRVPVATVELRAVSLPVYAAALEIAQQDRDGALYNIPDVLWADDPVRGALRFGMLLAPASTAALVTRRLGAMKLVAAVLGSVCTYAGLLVSYHADLAAGASVVAVAVGVFLATFAGVVIRDAVTGGGIGIPPGAVQRHAHTHDDGAHVHVHGAEHPHGHVPGERR